MDINSTTHRDYATVLNDLENLIPSDSQLWKIGDESSPDVVLLSLMAMLEDNASYNQDRQTLEVFPATVTQRKNANQIFSLMGYKMHWYRSATTQAILTNTDTVSGTVPRFSRFTTADESITYTNLEQVELPPNNVSNDLEYPVSLIQGIPYTPTKASNEIIASPGLAWHTIYNYNVSLKSIVNNRLYLFNQNVDETSITLIDDYGEQWVQVSNVDILTMTGKFFELRIDEYDQPYLELVSYWKNFICTQFKLFYIMSSGISGQVIGNALTKVKTPIVAVTGSSSNVIHTDISRKVFITNKESTYGYEPESPAEARKTSSKYINTLDTLITLDDFTKATGRQAGVANCIALDNTCDPSASLPEYTIMIYIVRTAEYSDYDDSVYKQTVLTALNANKILPLDLVIDLTSIKYYNWSITGTVYLKQPVTIDKSQDLLVKVNNQMKFDYDFSRIKFNSIAQFIDVIHSIESADPLIDYIKLNPIVYTDINNNVVSESAITGEYTESYTPVAGNYVYTFNLNNFPIRPTTLFIDIDLGTNSLTDDGNGRIIDNGQGILQSTGTINYATGACSFELTIDVNLSMIIKYTQNTLGIISYDSFSTKTFNVAPTSLLKS